MHHPIVIHPARPSARARHQTSRVLAARTADPCRPEGRRSPNRPASQKSSPRRAGSSSLLIWLAIIVFGAAWLLSPNRPASRPAEGGTFVQGSPRVHLPVIHDKIAQRVQFFRERETRELLPAMQRALTRFFEVCRGRVGAFLDWQYSYTARFHALANTAHNCWDHVANAGRWVFGYERKPVPDRNADLCRARFTELVLSETALKAMLAEAGEAFQSQIHRDMRALIRQLNMDLSSLLSEQVHIAIPEEEVERHFRQALQAMDLTAGLRHNLGALLVGTFVSEYLGGMAGTWAAATVSEWIVGNWYANLALSSRMLVWMGLSEVAGGALITGVAQGLVSTGIGLLAFAAVDWVFERITRPGVEERLDRALTGLERGLWSGDSSVNGLETLGTKAIDDFSEKFEETYREAVRRLIAARGLTS